MTDRLNKTSICSIIFLDMIDYSKKPVSEQIDDKTFFNALISEAIEDVAQNDRIIIDTGDGAAITLMGAPEEALFISLTIRDGVLERNKNSSQPLLVRIGINLGSVRVVKDINDRLNIIGDGINVAQRIMSFAGENEIMVSRSYYEVTSRLTKEMTGMFTYSGIKQDKHIREHEVYLIKPKETGEIVADSDLTAATIEGIGPDAPGHMIKKSSWTLLAGAGLLLGLIVWLFLSFGSKPGVAEPDISGPDKAVEPVSTKTIALDTGSKPEAVASNQIKMPKETRRETKVKKLTAMNDKNHVDNNSVPKKIRIKKDHSIHQQLPIALQVTKPVERQCTQAEITMNQCS